jgi:hypothetical protein
MMQPTDFRQANHLSERLNIAPDGRIFTKREMRSAQIVICDIGPENSSQVSLTKDDYVLETFSSNGTNEALDVGILPRRARRADDVLNSHGAARDSRGRGRERIEKWTAKSRETQGGRVASRASVA